tara:strand:+ start:37016 stop:37147 length:132 start_codon:yes stop_codon:yes gene_type:complete
MTGNQGQEPIVAGERHYNRTATRFATNRHWNYRGDNTKGKDKK